MSKHRSPHKSVNAPLVKIYLQEMEMGSFSVFSRLSPAIESNMSELERVRLMAALGSISQILGEHLSRIVSQEYGLELKTTVHRPT